MNKRGCMRILAWISLGLLAIIIILSIFIFLFLGKVITNPGMFA